MYKQLSGFVTLCCASAIAAGCGNGAGSQAVPGNAGAQSRPDIDWKWQKVTVSPRGGEISLPEINNSSGTLPYPSNNAANRVTLMVIDSGITNLLGVPNPGKSETLLFLSLQIDGSSPVEFRASTLKATIEAKKLEAGTQYALYLYEGKKRIRRIPIGSPRAGKIQFTTPLSKLTLRPSPPPLVLELGPALPPTPTPSLSPSPAPSQSPTPSPAPSALLYLSAESSGIGVHNASTFALIDTAKYGGTASYQLQVDTSGYVYVPSTSSSAVYVLSPGGGGLSSEYLGISSASAVAVGSNGTLYVGTANGSTSGNIYEFPPGSTTYTSDIATTGPVLNLALDGNGNLFYSLGSASCVYSNCGTSDVWEIPAGSTTPEDTGINAPTVAYLAIDAAGDLLASSDYCSSPCGSWLNVFPPGSTTASRIIATSADIIRGITFDSSGTKLFVSTGHGVSEYSYPGGALLHSYNARVETWGLAYAPALRPGAYDSKAPSLRNP